MKRKTTEADAAAPSVERVWGFGLGYIDFARQAVDGAPAPAVLRIPTSSLMAPARSELRLRRALSGRRVA